MRATIQKVFILFALVLAGLINLSAKEGMWLPVLLDKLNIGEMQSMGFKLSAEDVYSINQACLTDAVVLFGGGCTGEITTADMVVYNPIPVWKTIT